MNLRIKLKKSRRAGAALLMTMIMCGIALAILAAAMAWSASSTRLTYRSIQYIRAQAAAEAATDKVVGQMTRDFLYNGENLVDSQLNTYRQNTVPTTADSTYWNTWQFDDGNGNSGQTYVQLGSSDNYVSLSPPYAGLKAYVSTYTVVSHAKDTASIQDVSAGVLQQVQLATIPIFQFAMYSSGDMEVSCGEPFDVTGPVHSNGHLYVEPDSSLKFESDVTAVLDVLFQRDPLDTRGPLAGGVEYVETNMPSFPVAALTLPIGSSNSPEAIREIIEPPTDPTENPNSPLGRSRYYNQCDMIVTVSDSGVSATSGVEVNNKATPIPTNDLANFVSITTNSFWDGRENKTVMPIDLNIGNLAIWSQTNTSLRASLIGSNLDSVYVLDTRTPLTLPGNSLTAVRVVNGMQLPPKGLTVATARPLYVLGDYNTDSATKGTSNTTTTLPASLVADAITILSDAWQDANQQSANLNVASKTTVNAAFLTGVVETTQGQYSGGMENFPRFLESWGTTIFTYNGSMVKMFPSLYATNVWEGINYVKHYYDPPARNWAFDANFDDPQKLPPKTPSLLKVIRIQWAKAVPGQNVASAVP
ncbi:MAG TPA: hypothetical protein VIK53_17510 [Verrucomicrobiae bacterium]